MTNPEKLAELADKCEQASGPDRELDELISAAIAGAVREVQSDDHSAYHTDDGTRWVSVSVRPYTASLDAAMSLVPADADATGERFRLEHWNTNGVHAPHVRATAWVAGAARVYAATPALALVAASLRSLSGKRSSTDGEGR